MNWFVSEALRLLDYGDPSGRLHWTERVEVPMFLEVADLVFPDFLDQRAALGGSQIGIRPKIICEKRDAVLIKYFKAKAVGKFDCRQAATNSFHQDRVANVAENCPVRRADRTHNVGNQPIIRKPRMDRRHNRSVRRSRLFAPLTSTKILTDSLRCSRYGCDQLGIRSGKKHAVNIGMRIEGRVKPLLAGDQCLRRGENFRNFRQRLVIPNNTTAAAEIVADHMRYQLDQGLPIAQDS